MERLAQIKKLSEKDKVWDIVVVGGGATGLGVAVDAATRGLSVALLEKTDFAKCTSSRSTKLVHGGVRYLQKGDVMLVLEALRERGRMKANAPHLVKDQAFVISNYSYWDNFLYFCGLTFYDMLSFGFGYGRSKFISAKKVMKYIPTSVEKGLKGGRRIPRRAVRRLAHGDQPRTDMHRERRHGREPGERYGDRTRRCGTCGRREIRGQPHGRRAHNQGPQRGERRRVLRGRHHAHGQPYAPQDGHPSQGVHLVST